jgi:hypothetical protein
MVGMANGSAKKIVQKMLVSTAHSHFQNVDSYKFFFSLLFIHSNQHFLFIQINICKHIQKSTKVLESI